MSRYILDAFEKAGIRVASTTVDIVGAPELRVHAEGAPSAITSSP